MEVNAKFREAKAVFYELLSHINATRLSLSIMKMPLSVLEKIKAVSLYVSLSEKLIEFEVVDEIMRL
jgi:hypothetical protein